MYRTITILAIMVLCCSGCKCRSGHQALRSEQLSERSVLPDKRGMEALHVACRLGHKEEVERLLKSGVDINARSDDAYTPLHLSLIGGYPDIANMLIGKGADVNVKTTNWEQTTPLHLAAALGYESTVRLLVEKGADINAVDSGESTPLHLASSTGHKEVVEVLLRAGADCYATTEVGWTALHCGVLSGPDVVRILLTNGCSPNARDTDGETPLHMASMVHVAELLVKAGAVVNPKNDDNQTPLHYAAAKGNYELVEFLLTHGADPNARDTDNRTPLECARHQQKIALEQEDYGPVVALLESHTPMQ